MTPTQPDVPCGRNALDHARRAWYVARPTRIRGRLLLLAGFSGIAVLLIVMTVFRTILNEGVDAIPGYGSSDKLKVSVEIGPGLPPVPELAPAKWFEIVEPSQAEGHVRLSLENDRIVARIDLEPKKEKPRDDSRAGILRRTILWGGEPPDMRKWSAAIAVVAIRSVWTEDFLAGTSSQKWTWTNSDMPGRATEGGAAEAKRVGARESEEEDLAEGLLYVSLVLSSTHAIMGVMLAFAAFATLNGDRTEGRLEAHLSTSLGIGHVLFGSVLLILTQLVLGTLVAGGAAKAAAWYYDLPFWKAVASGTAGTLAFDIPAVTAGMVFALPVLWLALARPYHFLRTPPAYLLLPTSLVVYLCLPLIAEKATVLADATEDMGPVAWLADPVLLTLAPWSDVLAYLPMAGAVTAMTGTWHGTIPFAVSLASGLLLTVLPCRLILRKGRTWFLADG